MSDSATSHATAAAEISLVTLCASAACFLPPLSERVLDNVALVVLIGIALTVSLILHLAFVGILAKSQGRSAGRYAALALVTLPIGSIVGLIMFEWHLKVQHEAQQRAA